MLLVASHPCTFHGQDFSAGVQGSTPATEIRPWLLTWAEKLGPPTEFLINIPTRHYTCEWYPCKMGDWQPPPVGETELDHPSPKPTVLDNHPENNRSSSQYRKSPFPSCMAARLTINHWENQRCSGKVGCPHSDHGSVQVKLK